MPLLHVTDRLRTKWRNGKRESSHHHHRYHHNSNTTRRRSSGQKGERLEAPPNSDIILQGIGDYIFLDQLGRGKFSKVMLAQHTMTGENYAVKIIDKRIHDYRIISRLAREIDLMTSLEHPNIVRLFETYETADSLFLVLEYVEGVNLDEYLLQNRHLDEEEARSIFRQIVAAVDYCHSRSVVHRDLKAPNVLLAPDGRARLIDFGLGNRFGLQRLKTICGSMLYYSPEIITGQRYVGPEVDCWCLGILLFRMTTGYEPFGHARTVGELKQDVVNGNYPMPFHLSQDLQSTIRKCLALDKRHRTSVQQALRDDPWLTNHGRLPSPFTENTLMSFRHSPVTKIQNTIIYHPIKPSIYFTGPNAPQSDMCKTNFKDNETMRVDFYERFKDMVSTLNFKPASQPDASSSLFYRLRSSPNLRTMCKRLVKGHLSYYTIESRGNSLPHPSVLAVLRGACGLLGVSYQCQSTTSLLCVLNLRNSAEDNMSAVATSVTSTAPAPATQDHSTSPQQQQQQQQQQRQQRHANHHSSSIVSSWTSRFKRFSHTQPICSTSIRTSSLNQPSSLMSNNNPQPMDLLGPQSDDSHQQHEEGTAVFTIEILFPGHHHGSNLIALRFSKISGSQKIFKLAMGWINGVLF
ncbi:kinase-like domain-containing protein [Dichotomocladium elegans]|nr:kinase-like domain-containing protein [Dichotomocladium elegans]